MNLFHPDIIHNTVLNFNGGFSHSGVNVVECSFVGNFFMESFWYDNCNIFQYNEVTLRRMFYQLQSFIYNVGLCMCV